MSKSVPPTEDPLRVSSDTTVPVEGADIPFIQIDTLGSVSCSYPTHLYPMVVYGSRRGSLYIAKVPLWTKARVKSIAPNVVSWKVPFSREDSDSSPPLPGEGKSPPLDLAALFPFSTSSEEALLVSSYAVM